MDFRFFISEDKDEFSKEVKKFAQHCETNVDTLDLHGVLLTAFHQKYYQLVNNNKNKNKNKKLPPQLPTIIMSTHIYDTVYGRVVPETSDDAVANFNGYIPHSEAFLGGYMQNGITFPMELVRYFDGVIADAFDPIARHFLEDKISDKSQESQASQEWIPIESTTAERFALGKLTEQERLDRNKKLLSARIRGGTTSGKMRTFVTTLVSYLVNHGYEVEEALEMLPNQIKKLQKRHSRVVDIDGSDSDHSRVVDIDGSDSDEVDSLDSSTDDIVFMAFQDMIGHGKMEGKLQKDLDKIVKKLESLYKGSAISGLMHTLSSMLIKRTEDATTEIVVKQLTVLMNRHNKEDIMDDDIDKKAYKVVDRMMKYKTNVLDSLGELAEKLISSYRGSETTGLMSTLASMIVNTEDTKEDVVTVLDALKNNLHDDTASQAVFDALIKQKPDIDLSQLAEKLISFYGGGEMSGLMRTLASEYFKQPLEDDDRTYSKILERLEKMKAADGNKSESSKEVNQLYSAYATLVGKYCKIEEDLESLASFIYNVGLRSDDTFDSKLEELERLIKAKKKKKKKCKKDDVVIVTTKDGSALYRWWSDMTGWTQEKGLPPKYGPKLVLGQDRYERMESIGVCFDIVKIRTAMNTKVKDNIIDGLGGDDAANDAYDLMGMVGI